MVLSRPPGRLRRPPVAAGSPARVDDSSMVRIVRTPRLDVAGEPNDSTLRGRAGSTTARRSNPKIWAGLQASRSQEETAS